MYNLDELLNNKNLSDMMRQYILCKKQYMDCVLLYRVGDFYEMFFNDAIEVSNKLEITQTGKSCGLEERAPMCGIPYHAVNSYIPRLVDAGFKVAIAEQLTDPKTSKGLVDRDVIKIITPGTIVDEFKMDEANFLMSIFSKDDLFAISYIDINQGDIYSTYTTKKYLREEISKIKPAEIVFSDLSLKSEVNDLLNDYFIFTNEEFDESYLDEKIILNYFSKSFIDSLTFDDDGLLKNSLSILLNYIFYTQKRTTIANMNNIFIYESNKYMMMDFFTRDSLELVKKSKELSREDTLFSVLDRTNTAMGSRLLKQFINEPLIDKDEINSRLNIVEDLYNENLLREDLSKILKHVYDLERICSKIAFEKINAKELINLKKSVEELPLFKHLIDDSKASFLKSYIVDLDPLIDIYEIIDKAILENPSDSLTDGGIIKPSYNSTLEKYLDTLNSITEKISNLETSQRDYTGIKSLKIRKNDADGYYMEVTKKSIEGIELDNSYRKVKDLVNAYRYTFPELKNLEIDILEASNKSTNLEYNLFVEIRDIVAKNIGRIKKVAKTLSNIDVFISLAKVARTNKYVRPSLNEEGIFEIKNGRHPIIERTVDSFVPNDTFMNKNDELIHIITGPNMAGKSTYMRQVVLINIMAQIGSFVPCEEANIPIRDKVFTRIGASDNLAKGQSTFMVEMNEVSQILSTASKNSLIILDEVGRGTSTYDGISLAWAIVEYIEKNIKCHTLFATHYFELTDLSDKYLDIKNYTVSIEEKDDEITFLRKIIKGYTNQSYGIYVAQFAKLPGEVITNAKSILKELESKKKDVVEENSSTFVNSSLEKEIINLNLMKMNPMEVFNYLYNLQNRLKDENS